MKDPYSVLGIPKNATDEQVKNAYRELARKYHPDNYADNPLADLAGEKMKEVNDAYDAIMNERNSRKSKGSNANYNSEPSSFPEVRNLINQNRLEEAQILLDGVPVSSRNAEWYFLNGTVLYRRGWFDQAYTNFATACRMNPSNPEYQNALRNAQRSAGRQRNPYNNYSTGGGCDGCDLCSSLICADCCCECMGGDLISCC
ncbi:MAG: J domain-containing protein [Clostridia bacterium]|nr:J domain-containing protein [Clostridia bacterium]